MLLIMKISIILTKTYILFLLSSLLYYVNSADNKILGGKRFESQRWL